MSVQDLTNTTWVFKSEEEITIGGEGNVITYNISFTSNNKSYIKMQMVNDMGDRFIDYFYGSGSAQYDSAFVGDWTDNSYKTINITGGTDVTNATLISWLEANATQQVEPVAVTKLVNATELDSNLTSVANAIRAKSGGSSPLAFPAGFVSEIQSIPSGGGGLNLPNNLHLIVGNFPERYLDPGTSPGSVTFELKEVWYSTPTVQPGGYHDQTFTKTFTFDDTEGWEYYAHSIEDICTIFDISTSSLHIGSAGEYLEMRMTSVTGVSSWSTTGYYINAPGGDYWYFRTSNYGQYQYAHVSDIVGASYTDRARVRYDFVFEASWEDD